MLAYEIGNSYDPPPLIRITDTYRTLEDIAHLYPGSAIHRPSLSEYARSLELQGRLTPAVQEAIDKAAHMRATTRAIIYIAGPLTGVDEETKARYGMASELLETFNSPQQEGEEESRLLFGYVPHLHGTDPVKHPNVSADEVRDIDYLWASVVADYHINFLTPVAHGNAIEEGWAEMRLIPTGYVVPENTKLSRLTNGMHNIERVIQYQDFETQGMEGLLEFGNEFTRWLQEFPDRAPRLFYYLTPATIEDPLLRQNGLDPNEFNPVFPVDQFKAYVNDPTDPHYGEVGRILSHDWFKHRSKTVRFGNGRTVNYSDEKKQLRLWVA